MSSIPEGLCSTREVGKSGTSIVGLAFSPDGAGLASVSSDGEVWLLDSETGKELIPLRDSSGPYNVREVTVISSAALLGIAIPIWPGEKERFLSFSRDGGKITLSTVGWDTEGLSLRVETWDGTPREK